MKDPDTFLYWKMQFIGKMPLIDRNIKAVMGGIDLFKLKKGELIFFIVFKKLECYQFLEGYNRSPGS